MANDSQGCTLIDVMRTQVGILEGVDKGSVLEGGSERSATMASFREPGCRYPPHPDQACTSPGGRNTSRGGLL